jgi:hypothetical protein
MNLSRFDQGGTAMNNLKGRRARLGVLLVAALGALSIFILPGVAGARGGSDDGDSSATVKSFDQATKTLVVALPDGQSVSGTVTRRTKIRCEDQHGRRGHDRRGREAEPGDDRGGHGEEAGDDNGGHGEEPGDDHGGAAEPGDDNGGHGAEPGDDNGGDSSGPGPSDSGSSGHDDNGSGADCTTADLVTGAAVEEIELKFRGADVLFDEVELED